MPEDKWEEARRLSIEAVRQLEGKTVKSVEVDKRMLTLVLTDGSTLEVGCSVTQRAFSDVAELEFDFVPHQPDSKEQS